MSLSKDSNAGMPKSFDSETSSKGSANGDEKIMGQPSPPSLDQGNDINGLQTEKVVDADSERSSSEDYESDYSIEEDEEGPVRKAGFAELFRYATKWDLLFNFAGLLAACAAGAAQVRILCLS